jgi:Zn-dependent protease
MTKRQKTLVSLAGPATNLAFAIVLLALTSLLREPNHAVFWSGMAFQAFLQVTAFLINILPVPGLDGYSALEPHLSPQTQRAVAPAKGWAFLILLLLLFTPVVNGWFFGLVDSFFGLFGISSALWQIGMQLTRFWSAWF